MSICPLPSSPLPLPPSDSTSSPSSIDSTERRSSTTVVVKRISLIADPKSTTSLPAFSATSLNASLAHHIEHVAHSHPRHSCSSLTGSVNVGHRPYSHSKHVIYHTSDMPRGRRQLAAHHRHDSRQDYILPTTNVEDLSPESAPRLSSANKARIKLARGIRRIFAR